MKNIKQDNREIKYRVKPIVVVKPLNFMGKFAFRLMKFASWLFIKTGNDKI